MKHEIYVLDSYKVISDIFYFAHMMRMQDGSWNGLLLRCLKPTNTDIFMIYLVISSKHCDKSVNKSSKYTFFIIKHSYLVFSDLLTYSKFKREAKWSPSETFKSTICHKFTKYWLPDWIFSMLTRCLVWVSNGQQHIVSYALIYTYVTIFG